MNPLIFNPAFKMTTVVDFLDESILDILESHVCSPHKNFMKQFKFSIQTRYICKLRPFLRTVILVFFSNKVR